MDSNLGPETAFRISLKTRSLTLREEDVRVGLLVRVVLEVVLVVRRGGASDARVVGGRGRAARPTRRRQERVVVGGPPDRDLGRGRVRWRARGVCNNKRSSFQFVS